MADILEGKDAAFAVFEPFMQHLVTADLVFPDLRGNGRKILPVIDPDQIFGIFDGLDQAISLALETGESLLKNLKRPIQ